jgi:hypothetical protein
MVDGARDPRSVAARLGFDTAVIRRLESHGHLAKLALSDAEIQRRLYEGHRAHQRTSKRGSVQ